MAQATDATMLQGNKGLISHAIVGEGLSHTLVVVDPEASVVGVYHINPATGAIDLKSVRNVTWDLQMLEYNSDNPAPQDVRNGLPR